MEYLYLGKKLKLNSVSGLVSKVWEFRSTKPIRTFHSENPTD